MFVELNMLMEAGVFESDSGEKGLLAPYGQLKLCGGQACDHRAPGIPGDLDPALCPREPVEPWDSQDPISPPE